MKNRQTTALVRTSASRRASPAIIGILGGLLLFYSPTGTAAPSDGAAQPRAFPQISLESAVQGQEAIARLGNSLDELAGYYGKSTAEFTRLLREDSSLWLDRDGRAFYQDKFSRPEAHSSAQADRPAPFPLSDTFTLASRPGAARVIYLDFSGNVTRDTAFNRLYQMQSIDSPAYSLDAGQAFSREELRRIQLIWQQVAEDFAPFDVNVTTRFPGDSKMNRRVAQDTSYGTRVVISPEAMADCDCDGISYLGAFDDIGSSRKPVFVFTGGGDISGKEISHQVGHSLGLHHDSTTGESHAHPDQSTGQPHWAPVMAPYHGHALVQWSAGNYAGASNFEDDLMQMQASGLPLLPDDHSDTPEGATYLASSSEDSVARLVGSGLIGQAGDIDVFQFHSGAGSYSIEVSPLGSPANLDVELEVYDANGKLVARANPGHSPAAVVGGRLPAGTYYLHVDGAASFAPGDNSGNSDYGSLGRYAVGGIVAHPGSLGTPEALVVADYEAGLAPMPVRFDGEVYNRRGSSIVSWHWDFGDGHYGSGENAEHTYGNPGIYTATLTVTDARGRSDTDSVVVAVEGMGTAEHPQDGALAATDSSW